MNGKGDPTPSRLPRGHPRCAGIARQRPMSASRLGLTPARRTGSMNGLVRSTPRHPAPCRPRSTSPAILEDVAFSRRTRLPSPPVGDYGDGVCLPAEPFMLPMPHQRDPTLGLNALAGRQRLGARHGPFPHRASREARGAGRWGSAGGYARGAPPYDPTSSGSVPAVTSTPSLRPSPSVSAVPGSVPALNSAALSRPSASLSAAESSLVMSRPAANSQPS